MGVSLCCLWLCLHNHFLTAPFTPSLLVAAQPAWMNDDPDAVPATAEEQELKEAVKKEVNAPDGSTIRADVPALSAFQEARVSVNWTVPEEQPIGTVSISFEVDPDGIITEDENPSNNIGNFEIFIGRLAIPIITANDPVWTFDNVTIDASASQDPDSGEVRCEFRIFSAEGVEFNEWEDDCILEFNWSDDGIMLVDVFVIDDDFMMML